MDYKFPYVKTITQYITGKGQFTVQKQRGSFHRQKWKIYSPLWCDLGFFLNSHGNKAAANLHPTISNILLFWD